MTTRPFFRAPKSAQITRHHRSKRALLVMILIGFYRLVRAIEMKLPSSGEN